jgi:hypothetical protein
LKLLLSVLLFHKFICYYFSWCLKTVSGSGRGWMVVCFIDWKFQFWNSVSVLWPITWGFMTNHMGLYDQSHGALWMKWVVFGFMVFSSTFNNISVISRWSVLLVEETGETHRPVASHWQTISHNVVSSTPTWVGFELTTLVVRIA